MKKLYYLVSTFLLGILAFNIGLGFVVASDYDDDGVDDDFEDLNKRNMDIEFNTDGIEIESTKMTGNTLDEIELTIEYKTEGLSIDLSYESEFEDTDDENETESEFELEFEVTFRKLVEYIDLNNNGIYEESIDYFIQNYELDSFKDVVYTVIAISNESSLYYFIISTTDDVFTAHIYLVEEFTIINNTLITPMETKIDIEIKNFNYLEESSQLALYVTLSAEYEYEVEYETEDEQEGYSEDEEGVATNANGFQGFFTWAENATIDGTSRKVLVNNLQEDDYNSSEQKLYLNYPRGAYIYHDPKIGIAPLQSGSSLFPIIITVGSVLVLGIAITIIILLKKGR